MISPSGGLIPAGATSTILRNCLLLAVAISAAAHPPIENPITSIGATFRSRTAQL